jgi:predicted DCC family thiol-disulfide oxidoreductase YuxK
MTTNPVPADSVPLSATAVPVVYYDASCPLCSMEIAHYRACEGAKGLVFLDVSDPACQMPADLDRQQALARFHVRLADGSLRSGAAGFVALWDQLPRWRWLSRIARQPVILSWLETAYVLILPVRPRLARWLFRRARSGPPSSAV